MPTHSIFSIHVCTCLDQHQAYGLVSIRRSEMESSEAALGGRGGGVHDSEGMKGVTYRDARGQEQPRHTYGRSADPSSNGYGVFRSTKRSRNIHQSKSHKVENDCDAFLLHNYTRKINFLIHRKRDDNHNVRDIYCSSIRPYPFHQFIRSSETRNEMHIPSIFVIHLSVTMRTGFCVDRESGERQRPDELPVDEWRRPNTEPNRRRAMAQKDNH